MQQHYRAQHAATDAHVNPATASNSGMWEADGNASGNSHMGDQAMESGAQLKSRDPKPRNPNYAPEKPSIEENINSGHPRKDVEPD